MSSGLRQRSWLWLHLVVLLGGSAFAAPEPSKVVLLEAVGEARDVEALRTSLEDWLRALQLELHLVSALPPIDEPSFARVRAVWTDASCIVEVFSREGVLRRRKELPRGGPPLLVSESAALIAQAGVQEVSIEEKKRQPLPAPVEARPSAAPLVEVPVDVPPFGLRVAGFFQGRAYGESAPVAFGGGAEVSASFGDASWRPGVSLLLGYQGPLFEETSVFRIQLQTAQVRVLPSLRKAFGSFEVELGAGGGLDVLFAHTSTQAVPRNFVRSSRVDAAPFFSVAASARWHLTPSTSLFVRALVDVDPARRVYVSNIGGERETHLVPWIGRPALHVGFSFDILARPERSP